MTKKVETVVVPEDDVEIYDADTGEFIQNHPTKFYIQLATGDWLFFRTRSRMLAQQTADEMFGKGFYTVNSSKQSGGNGNYTCRV